MPTIDLDPQEVAAFERLCRENDIEIPDERPTLSTWADADDDREMDPERFAHDAALDRLLFDLGQACPVCGDPDCDEETAYIGATMIHASDHPERRAERAREREAAQHLR